MVAYGAALSLNGMFKEADPEASDAPVTFLPLTEWVSRLEQVQEDAKKKQHSGQEHAAPLFFSSKEEHDTFLKEHPKGDFTPGSTHTRNDRPRMARHRLRQYHDKIRPDGR